MKGILIIGCGRMAHSVAHYLKKGGYSPPLMIEIGAIDTVDFSQIDVMIGTLPGRLGHLTLRLALEKKVDLIDLADADLDLYTEAKDAIDAAGIRVFPAAGFCPGLVNCILGHALSQQQAVKTVEVKAGSLSPKDHYFPFLWCFEDMVLEFINPSTQTVNGENKAFPAFAGYREEEHCGITAETYLSQSGFENLAEKYAVPNFYYRNIRPVGFRSFFLFLHNHGCLNKKNLPQTKALLEELVDANFSTSEISIETKEQRETWQIISFSDADETLNSMQKITAQYTYVIVQQLLAGNIDKKGLLLAEELGEDAILFPQVIAAMQELGTTIVNIVHYK